MFPSVYLSVSLGVSVCPQFALPLGKRCKEPDIETWTGLCGCMAQGHGQGGDGGAVRAQPSSSTSMSEEEVLRTLRDMKKSKKEQFFMRHDASRASCRGNGEELSQNVSQDVTCAQSAGKHRRYSGALAGSPLPIPPPSPGGMVPATARMVLSRASERARARALSVCMYV